VTAQTVVARRTKVGGRIETEGSVLVEGRVEGSIRAGDTIVVAPSGLVIAEVEGETVEVRGIVIGNVTATRRVEVTAGARVVGDLRSPEIAVAAEATVEGRIERTGSPRGPRTPVPSRDPRPTLRLRPPSIVPVAPAEAPTDPGGIVSGSSVPPVPRLTARARIVPRRGEGARNTRR
jgi:cytoskeletal protein CcmA (bactofilin family)